MALFWLFLEAKHFENGTDETGSSNISQLTISKSSSAPDFVKLGGADEPANYDAVRIEDFGLAMLRGMGWSEGEPMIGRTNKAVVPARIPELRPKGVGLGALLPNPNAAPVKAPPDSVVHEKKQKQK